MQIFIILNSKQVGNKAPFLDVILCFFPYFDNICDVSLYKSLNFCYNNQDRI